MAEVRSTLVVIASVRGVLSADGAWILPRKFVSGIAQFAQNWPGEVVVILQGVDSAANDLDNREWVEARLPCRFMLRDFRSLKAANLPGYPCCTVLMFPHHQLHDFAQTCLDEQVPVTMIGELSLRTQLDIARVSRPGLLSRLRSHAWLYLEHRRWMRFARHCRSVHCNGVPAYDEFRPIAQDTLLFFDTRTQLKNVTDRSLVERRLTAARARGYPRLFFSGRLIPIKGVDYLIGVARELRARGFHFEMLIAGDGDRRSALAAQITRDNLADCVQLIGVLDFETELNPLLQDSIDIFICPHVQGDPSCTYLETLAAGVPISGFDNEALVGVVKYSAAGWVTPLGDPKALASQIIQAWQDPAELLRASLLARDFAEKHSFESEFARRIAGLVATR